MVWPYTPKNLFEIREKSVRKGKESPCKAHHINGTRVLGTGKEVSERFLMVLSWWGS